MSTKQSGQVTIIKPFNHIPASSFFRLACIVDFNDDPKLFTDATNTQKALKQLKHYERSLKGKTKKRVLHVRGRRISIERMFKSPFKKVHSQIFYGVAVEIEKILERHYQIRSGETYFVLSKAASQMYEAVSSRVATLSGAATVMKGGS
jgi:hypothetical protein